MHWPLSGLGGEPFAKRQVQRKHVRTMDGLLDTRAQQDGPACHRFLSGLAEVEQLMIRERTLESIEYRRPRDVDL